MKFTIPIVVTIACSIVLAFSQTKPDPPTFTPKAPGIPPKTLPSPYSSPTPIPNYPSVRERPLAITADKMTVNGRTVQYQGHARMTTESVIVTADELEYDTSAQSAKATGNVAIQVRPPGPLVVPLSQ